MSAKTAAATDTKERIHGSIFCTTKAPVIEYDNGTSIGGTRGDTIIIIHNTINWTTIILSFNKKNPLHGCLSIAKELVKSIISSILSVSKPRLIFID